MEEIDKTQPKLPNQEIDYFKIAKILLSRWYWIAGSVGIAMIIANVYLWYTPKTYATSGTLKFEEKKSEMSDLVSVIGSNDRGQSKIQSETTVLQSRNVIVSAVKDLDYRISFYIVGRVVNRTNELYPQKPLDIQFLKFDSVNFYHDLISFKPINKDSFSLTYPIAGKEVEKVYNYNSPFTIGPTAMTIKYPGELARNKNVEYLFKFNSPDDFVGRVRGGLHTSEIVKNSSIISVQEIDSNPQFAADILNAIMKEYLTYNRIDRMQSATQMIDFIDKLIPNNIDLQGTDR